MNCQEAQQRYRELGEQIQAADKAFQDYQLPVEPTIPDTERPLSEWPPEKKMLFEAAERLRSEREAVVELHRDCLSV